MKTLFSSLLGWLGSATVLVAAPGAEPPFPPALPGGQAVATDTSPAFLEPTETLRPGVAVARTAPTIDVAFFPAQTYPGRPWSAWGDSLVVNGKYYASMGDHLAPGNAFVFEYDPALKQFRQLVDVRALLQLPEGHYTPGKIHSRLDLGGDGWLYFSTHRGSTRITTDEFHYQGDWILRVHPETGRPEIVARGPVPKHCLPASVLDPTRLIFYGGTAPGVGRDEDAAIQFYAYDLRNRRVLHTEPNGPSRCLIFAPSTGRVYYTTGKSESALMRFDPRVGRPERIPGELGIRAATQETPQGIVYTVSSGQGEREAMLYAFDVRREQVTPLGPAAVGSQQYITSLDADPSGRYLYYVPGAHGGSERDGCPVVQFDTRTRRKKVIAFLHPFYANHHGCTLKGTFSSALDQAGEKLFITWNNSRGGKTWDSCVLTVVHIPAAERRLETTLNDSAAAAQFRVMTFNIHHGEGADGRVDLARLAEVVRRERADIVALQEVDRGVARTAGRDLTAELAELTGLRGVFSHNLDYQGGQYGNAILTRFPVSASTNHHYRMLRPGEQRGLQQVQLEISGQPVLVLNTHIDYRPDDSERLANVDEIRLAVARQTHLPVIVCGDFNDLPNRPVHQKMAETFVDVWTVAGQGDGFTFPSTGPVRRIDYIWTGRTAPLRALRAWVPATEASDHRPVVAEFELTPISSGRRSR